MIASSVVVRTHEIDYLDGIECSQKTSFNNYVRWVDELHITPNMSRMNFLVRAIELRMRHGGGLEACKFLIDNGANIHFKNFVGDTALLIALQKKRDDIARLLIACGADCTAVNNDNEGCLLYAVKMGNCVDVVQELINRKASISHYGKQGPIIENAILAYSLDAVKFIEKVHDVDYSIMCMPRTNTIFHRICTNFLSSEAKRLTTER
jgi:ankyrin repeat protein